MPKDCSWHSYEKQVVLCSWQLKPKRYYSPLMSHFRFVLPGGIFLFLFTRKQNITWQKFKSRKLCSCRIPAGHHPLLLGKGTFSSQWSLQDQGKRPRQTQQTKGLCGPQLSVTVASTFTSWGVSPVTSHSWRHKSWLYLSRSNRLGN